MRWRWPTAARGTAASTNLEFSLYGRWYEANFIFREVIVFADCCRQRQAMVPAMGPGWRLSPDRRGKCTFQIAFATELGELAHEAPAEDADLARGYFTQALIDGLNGGAAHRETGEIDLGGLLDYATTSVEYQLKDRDFGQTPETGGTKANPVLRPPLGPLPRKSRHMTLHLPEGAQGQFELWRDDRPTGTILDASQATHELDLEEDVYELRSENGVELAKNGVFRVIAMDRDVQF